MSDFMDVNQCYLIGAILSHLADQGVGEIEPEHLDAVVRNVNQLLADFKTIDAAIQQREEQSK